MTKSAFYEVYFTIIHEDKRGEAKYKNEYMATQTADSKAEAIAMTKAGTERMRIRDEIITNFMAQKID